MEIIYFLVPIGVIMLAVAIAMFTWAVKSDQFEDLDREGRRILFDEDMVAKPSKSTSPPVATAAPEASSAPTAPSVNDGKSS